MRRFSLLGLLLALASGCSALVSTSDLFRDYPVADGGSSTAPSGANPSLDASGGPSERYDGSADGDGVAIDSGKGSDGGTTTDSGTHNSPSPTASGYLQSASTGNYTTASSNLAIAFPYSVTPKNTLVLAIHWLDPVALSTLTDNAGNTYETAVSNETTAIYYATNVHGGPTTVMAHFSGPTRGALFVHEYANLDPTSPVDDATFAVGNDTTPDTGYVTTTNPRELIFSFCAVENAITSVGGGMAPREKLSGKWTTDMLATSAGSYDASFTQDYPGDWNAVIVAFKTR